jgi:atlastin
MGDGNEPLEGFTWKHGRKADTKGVLFWPDVFLHDTPEEKIAIVIMDTQGLFETNSTYEENSRIFGLSNLISSIQIVNTQGVMQENQIEHLEMAIQLTRFIARKQLEASKILQWKPFQKLLFLIRDWTDDEIEGGFGYDGGDTYLKEFLDTESDHDTKSLTIRKNICGSFDSIDCFLLNHPGNKVAKNNFNGEWGKLKEAFVCNLKILIESILKPENLLKKSILGKEVTCSELRDFIHNALKVFQETQLPEVKNIFEITIKNHLRGIVEEQFKIYQKKMRTEIDFDSENFEELFKQKHENVKKEAIQSFLDADKMDDTENVLTFREKLENDIEEAFKLMHSSIMFEYKRYLNVMDQIKLHDIKEEEQQQLIERLRFELETIAQKNSETQQAIHEIDRRLEEQRTNLEEQIIGLNLSAEQTDSEISNIRTSIQDRALEIRNQFEIRRMISIGAVCALFGGLAWTGVIPVLTGEALMALLVVLKNLLGGSN